MSTINLLDVPSGSKIDQWLLGIIMPILPIGYGISGLINGRTMLIHLGSFTPLTGAGAILLSCAFISLGLTIHFHYFWGLSRKLWPLSHSLKIIAFFIYVITFFSALLSLLA